MGGVLSGHKFSNNHQTFIPGAENILKALKYSDSIKKIMLGEITKAKTAKSHCKIRSINGNLITLVYRGVSSVQVIRAVATDISSAKQLIDLIVTDRDNRESKKNKIKNNKNNHKRTIKLTPYGSIRADISIGRRVKSEPSVTYESVFPVVDKNRLTVPENKMSQTEIDYVVCKISRKLVDILPNKILKGKITEADIESYLISLGEEQAILMLCPELSHLDNYAPGLTCYDFEYCYRYYLHRLCNRDDSSG